MKDLSNASISSKVCTLVPTFSPPTPINLLLVMTASIFTAEALCMFILSFLPHLDGFAAAIIDSAFLVILVFPILYCLSYNPLLTEIKQRYKAQMELLQAHDELERRVENRTLELAQTNDRLTREIEERKRVETELRSYQAQLRSLSSELSLTEEQERRRIATALHDRVGQNLAAISITKLEALKDKQDAQAFTNAFDEIRTLMDQTIQDTRTLIFELSPPMLHELGLEATLEWLTDHLRQAHDIRVDMECKGAQISMDEATRGFLYQAVRVLLGSIAEHSRATRVHLSIHKEAQAIKIEISDNGNGFSSDELNLHLTTNSVFGFFKIRERLEYLGGHFEIDSESGKGTHATMWTPLRASQTNI